MPPTARQEQRATTVAEATGGTVARRKDDDDRSPKGMVRKYERSFGRVLPDHISQEMFVALANAEVARKPDLYRAAVASPSSFIHALMDCAALGHRPGHNYALTAREITTKKGDKFSVVLGIEEYTGKIERMYRTGMVRTVKAEVVRANDHYVFNQATMDVPDHQFDDFASFEERGPMIGVWAYAVLRDGSVSRVVRLNKEQVAAHREKATMKAIWNDPIFGQDMWLKTGLHVLEKFVPTSPAYLSQIIAASTARAELAQEVGEPPVDYTGPFPEALDGEVVDDEPPTPEG
jgi:recombination protein RecT